MNNFESEVRKATKKVAQIVHPNLSVSAEAAKVLAKILTNFNHKLIAECRKNFKPKKGNNTMREQSAQKAVERLLCGQLRNLAMANAHKTLALYAAGLLTYTPTDKQTKKRKKGEAPDEFVKCVLPLSRLVNPSIKIAKDAKLGLAQLLFKMSKLIVEKSQEVAADKHALSADEIIKAVDFFMTPNMAKHAISEGTKNAFLFSNGCHYYTQEKFAEIIR